MAVLMRMGGMSLNNRFQLHVLAVSALMLCMTTAALALEPHVWVDDSWTGAGDCGGHNWGVDAFSTIAGALAAVDAGGTVSVIAGTYPERFTIGKAGVTLEGDGTHPAIAPSGTGTIILTTAANITIRGMEIRGASWGSGDQAM